MKNICEGILFLAISLLMFSCEKADPVTNTTQQQPVPNNYFVKAKFNGVQKDFLTSAVASKNNMGGFWSLAIIGQSGLESCTVSLWSFFNDFTQGKTYGIPALNGNTYNTYGYFENPTGPNAEWISEYAYGPVTSKFQCTITAVTDTTIKGTFHADLYKAVPGAQQKIVVTEGEFFVKMQ